MSTEVIVGAGSKVFSTDKPQLVDIDRREALEESVVQLFAESGRWVAGQSRAFEPFLLFVCRCP